LFKNNVEDEADFCEAYKSQILNDNLEEDESSITSILTILLLLMIIIALSIYGYNYFMNSDGNTSTPPASAQMIDDDELKVKVEELPVSPMIKEKVAKSKEEEKALVKSDIVPPKSNSLDLDIDQMADEVKIAISKNEAEENLSSKNKTKKSAPSVEGTKPTYVEELANESSIERDEKSAYIRELEKLTAEIDKERE
jgi:hypothetical protein